MAWYLATKEGVIIMVILLILFIIQRFLRANCELRNAKLAKTTWMTVQKPKMMATKPKMMATKPKVMATKPKMVATKMMATTLQMVAMSLWTARTQVSILKFELIQF